MQVFAPALQRRHHRVEIEIVVAQRDVQFVEHQKADRWIGHQLEHLGPGSLGGGDVALQILRFPGKTLAHRVPDDPVAESGKGVLLAGMPFALDELDDADAPAVAEHPQRQPEGGSGLALAGPGVDDQQSLLDCLGRDLGVLHRLALGHLGAVAFLVPVVDIGHITSP